VNNLTAYLQLLRPKQWVKNFTLLFPPLFGGELFDQEILLSLLIPFFVFCLASSANYALNDVLDADKDALHPTKRFRPIPAGTITWRTALMLSALLFITAFSGAIIVSWPFTAILVSYALLMGSYSLWLKHIVLLDIFVVSLGFLLRLEAGGIATDVSISSWLFLSVFFLAVFLSTGKRLGEKLLLSDDSASAHRKTLSMYPSTYLEGLMMMTGTSALLTYALYTVEHPLLVYTVPLCCLGLFRYFFWIKTGHSGDPTEALLKDRFLTGISIAWLLAVLGQKYWSIIPN